MRSRVPRAPGWVVWTVGAVAAFLYSNFLLTWALTGRSELDVVVSRLEVSGQPYATTLRVTDVVCAVLVVILLPWVRVALPRGAWREVCVWATVVFAVGASLAAVYALPCSETAACGDTSSLGAVEHVLSSVGSDTALYAGTAAAWLATRDSGPRWFVHTAAVVFVAGGLVSSAVFAVANQTDAELLTGVVQRLHILSISVWILALTALATRPPERWEGPVGSAPT